MLSAIALMPALGVNLETNAESLSCDVQEVRAQVLSNPDDALEALVVSAWPQMAASSHTQLQLFISLLTDICRDKVMLPTRHSLYIPYLCQCQVLLGERANCLPVS